MVSRVAKRFGVRRQATARRRFVEAIDVQQPENRLAFRRFSSGVIFSPSLVNWPHKSGVADATGAPCISAPALHDAAAHRYAMPTWRRFACAHRNPGLYSANDLHTGGTAVWAIKDSLSASSGHDLKATCHALHDEQQRCPEDFVNLGAAAKQGTLSPPISAGRTVTPAPRYHWKLIASVGFPS